MRGGSRVEGASSVPRFSSRIFSGAETHSIHLKAASWFLLPENTTRWSDATVVAQRSSCGSGAVAHKPVTSGNSVNNVPANHEPAMYMATSPLANATRPSHELEFKKSGGEYFTRL